MQTRGRMHYLVRGRCAAIDGEELERGRGEIIRLSPPQLAVNRRLRSAPSLPPSVGRGRFRAGGRAAERRRLRPLMSVGAIGGGYEMHICSDREDGGRTGARESGAGLHAPQESVFWARIIRRPFLARWAVRYGGQFLRINAPFQPILEVDLSSGPPRNRFCRQVELQHWFA